MENPYNTPNPNIPPALASLLSVGSSAAPAPSAGLGGMSSGMTRQQTFAPSYEMGGMIGAGGMPESTGVGVSEPGQMPQGGTSPQMLEMQVNQFATQHPEQLAQIRSAIQQATSSGELTPQELNTVVQLATVAAQNPEMYPYVRKFAIQQGIATDQDLPQQYDQGLVFVLLLAARAVQTDGAGQGMMQGGAPQQPQPSSPNGAVPSMSKGGMTPDSKKSDGSVLINAHEGEYVIPANVVKMKGKEFFDGLVEKYRDTD